MFDDIKHKEVKFYDFHSKSAKDLLSKLLIKDPSKRLSSVKLIQQHAFYSSLDWD